jgi:TRAP-type C4-dicarboxylate transport system substrate-binding protein
MRHTASRMTIAALLVAVGCGGDAPSRAGGASPPITLTALASAGPGSPAGDQLADFAERVADLSERSMTIEVLENLGATQEREAVETVQNGAADIGVVPARIFDTMGVTTLRALQAPFLIDSNELADRSARGQESAHRAVPGVDG